MSSILPYLFMLLGVTMAVLGIRGWRQVADRRRRWRRFPGEVFDYTWDRTGGNESVQYWMLRWVGADGVQRTAKNPHGVSGGTLREFPFPMEVLVDPDDPRQAQVAKGSHSGLMGVVLMIPVGLIFLALGILIAVF